METRFKVFRAKGEQVFKSVAVKKRKGKEKKRKEISISTVQSLASKLFASSVCILPLSKSQVRARLPAANSPPSVGICSILIQITPGNFI